MTKTEYNDYEEIIERIERLWLAKTAKVTRNAEVRDIHSGESREIDVLIEVPVGSAIVRVGIECRCRKNKQDVKWIEELYGKKVSCGLSKILAVSKQGFTAPAIAKAKQFGIDLRHAGYLDDHGIVTLADEMKLNVKTIQYRAELVRLVLQSTNGKNGAKVIFKSENPVDQNLSVWGTDKEGLEYRTKEAIEHYMNVDPDIKHALSPQGVGGLIYKSVGYDLNREVSVETEFGPAICLRVILTMWAMVKMETVPLKRVFSYTQVDESSKTELFQQSKGVLRLAEGVNVEFTRELRKNIQA